MDAFVSERAWMALRQIGAPEPPHAIPDRGAVDQLVDARLVEIRDGLPVITPAGRQVIIRGGPSRWTGAF